MWIAKGIRITCECGRKAAALVRALDEWRTMAVLGSLVRLVMLVVMLRD